VKTNHLEELLESLKEEVDHWELDPPPEDPVPVRRGLYLLAMDILLAETRSRGGFESYRALPDRARLPESDYLEIRKQLTLFIQWLENINIERAAELVVNAGIPALNALEEVCASNEPVFSEWLVEVSK
jgi:hypothetical protein